MTTLAEALHILGLEPGQSLHDARLRYRELLMVTHPDLATEELGESRATTETIAVTRAFEVIRQAVSEGDGSHIPEPEEPPTPPQHSNSESGTCRHRQEWQGPFDTIEIRADDDTLFITAPPAEAFALLLDAGSRIGGIGYVDRNLGLLELIVRFEGGPSCSVLITMQGRAFGTDAFITMESIEADPTPALAPVMEALLEELADLHAL